LLGSPGYAGDGARSGIRGGRLAGRFELGGRSRRCRSGGFGGVAGGTGGEGGRSGRRRMCLPGCRVD